MRAIDISAFSANKHTNIPRLIETETTWGMKAIYVPLLLFFEMN
jgi:hypothetical protein